MNLKLSSNVTGMDYKSYTNPNEIVNINNLIDCSLGTNPFGSAVTDKATLIQLINSMEISYLEDYPHNHEALTKEILNYWNVDIDSKTQIFLGGGSIDLLSKATRLFLSSGTIALGYAPQFTNFKNEVDIAGAKYDFLRLDKDSNYKFNSREFLEKIHPKYQLIYIDNPNNPTGQMIPLGEIEAIVKRASKLGICCIIDEAYGDFMKKSNSAIHLLKENANIVVLRSFSKGLGLAGIRAGYLLTSPIIGEYFERITNPFSLNSIAVRLAIHTLKDGTFMKASIQNIRESKQRILNEQKKLKILETLDSTPIMTVIHPDESVDLARLFSQQGIKVIPGREFQTLGHNSIRLRVPRLEAELTKVIQTFI